MKKVHIGVITCYSIRVIVIAYDYAMVIAHCTKCTCKTRHEFM